MSVPTSKSRVERNRERARRDLYGRPSGGVLRERLERIATLIENLDPYPIESFRVRTARLGASIRDVMLDLGE